MEGKGGSKEGWEGEGGMGGGRRKGRGKGEDDSLINKEGKLDMYMG